MKKATALLLIIAFIFMTFPSVSAETLDAATKIYTSDFGYEFECYNDNLGRTVRTYKSTNVPQNCERAFNLSGSGSITPNQTMRTKAILTDLGMGEDFINNLSSNTLDMYANAESITSVTSYTKTSSDGTVEIVDEATALEQSALINSIQPRVPVIPDDEGYYDDPSYYYGELEDTYMRITFWVTNNRDGTYLFSVDALWLTMPIFRGWDSIGVCSTYISIENNTRSGWYSYQYNMYSTFSNPISYEEEYTFNDSNIQNCINGSWNGSGAKFNLPDNIYSESGFVVTQVYYSAFKAHYEFVGSITLPEQTVVFNAIASYDHATIDLTLTPSLGISIDGIGGSLGLAINGSKDKRIVELPTSITYTP